MATFRPRTLVLFLGDIFFFTFALWLSLILRALGLPSAELLAAHVLPFSILFAIWIAVFFVAGLYETRSIILARRALSATLLVAQTINVGIAAVFFFAIPLFGIAPKTILLIYLVVSFLLVLFWRAILFPRLGLQKPEPAVAIGEGREIDEFVEALARAPLAPARVVAVVRPSDSLATEIAHTLKVHRARFVIADFEDERVTSAFPEIYNLISSGVRFFDVTTLYEQVFGRIPLSILDDRWLARNVSRYAHTGYDGIKRAVDIVFAVVGGLVSLVFYPFIMLAIKLEDRGPVFVSLPRIGEGGTIIHIHKFRSMTGNDGGNYGPHGASKLSVTRVGKFLRRTRLDELPQFWNLLVGDVAFIGPRPETPALVEVYSKTIPYYGVRHLIKPGLSGWAQLYHHQDPHHATDVEATRMKLSYDLYYLKHRSLALDLIIAVKTVRRVLLGNA